MDDQQYRDAITRSSTAVVAAAERAGLDAPVPSCPEWTMADLVEHLGNVQRWATRMVETLPRERISRAGMSESPPRGELLGWFHDATRALVDTLAAADRDAPVWTFGPSGVVAFWSRRQAQEAAIHRWDAESAAGSPSALDRELATDGIAEWLEISSAVGRDRLAGAGETVHLHCTDAGDHEGEWLVTLADDGPTIAPIHAKGDVAARGTASDLDLFLWGRVGVDALEVFGDAALLERLRRDGMG